MLAERLRRDELRAVVREKTGGAPTRQARVEYLLGGTTVRVIGTAATAGPAAIYEVLLRAAERVDAAGNHGRTASEPPAR
jgi:hypothetical protein